MSTEHNIIALIGDNTEVRVFFRHEPEEPMVFAGPNAYPGAHAQVVIWAVQIDGDDISENLSEDCLARLEERCWDYIRGMK